MRTEDLPIVRKYNVRCYRQSAVHGSWEQWAGWKKDSDREEDRTVVCDLFRVSSSRVCVCVAGWTCAWEKADEEKEGEKESAMRRRKRVARIAPPRFVPDISFAAHIFFAFHSSTRFSFPTFPFFPLANDEYYNPRNFRPRSSLHPRDVIPVNSDN